VQNELAAAPASGTDDGGAPARSQYVSEVLLSGDYPLLAGALSGRHQPENPEETFSRIISNYLAGAGIPPAPGSAGVPN
jgi:hypothetical protein